MVAQSAYTESYYLPKPAEVAAAQDPICPNKQQCPTHIQKGAALAAGEDEREEGVSGEESDSCDDGQDAGKWESKNPLNQEIETVDSPTSDIDEQDDKLVMADTGEEDREGGQEEVDDLSSGISGDESQDGKMDRNPGWRKKTQQKMEYGKKWITSNLSFVRTGGCMVPLSAIAGKYRTDCQRESQEPLLLSVLARLLHQQFPEAGKCRLGPRGNQKIHYSKLRWQVSKLAQQCNSATTPMTPAIDGIIEKTPFEGSPSPQMQGDGKEPQTLMSGRGVEKKQHMSSDALNMSPNQLVGNDDDEGEKECPEAAIRLHQVVKKVSSQGKRDLLLKIFAHSASCHNTSCTSLCLMFRRVRRHVVSARHACRVLQIYSVLLKLHVASCIVNDCGLTACPALRASRQIKRGMDEEHEEVQQEEGFVQQPSTKRLNVLGSHLPRVLMRQSSTASLPDSQPSTPLLPSTPSTLQPIQFMLVPMQPMLKPETCSIPERVGA